MAAYLPLLLLPPPPVEEASLSPPPPPTPPPSTLPIFPLTESSSFLSSSKTLAGTLEFKWSSSLQRE